MYTLIYKAVFRKLYILMKNKQDVYSCTSFIIYNKIENCKVKIYS